MLELHTVRSASIICIIASGKAVNGPKEASMPDTRCWYIVAHTPRRNLTFVLTQAVRKLFQEPKTSKFILGNFELIFNMSQHRNEIFSSTDLTPLKNPIVARFPVARKLTQIQVIALSTEEPMKTTSHTCARYLAA